MTVMDGGRRPAGRRVTASRISSRMARAWAEPSIRRAGTRRVYRGHLPPRCGDGFSSDSPSPLRGGSGRVLSSSGLLADRDADPPSPLPGGSGRVLSSSWLLADRDADPPSPLRGGVGEGVSLYHDFSLPA